MHIHTYNKYINICIYLYYIHIYISVNRNLEKLSCKSEWISNASLFKEVFDDIFQVFSAVSRGSSSQVFFRIFFLKISQK